MFTYVVKRVLLMVPTLFGISLVLWLVMLAAPGRPGGDGAGFGETETKGDPTKDIAKGESEFLFRRQFALDRPVFWNGWTSLTVADVRAALDDARAPIQSVGAKRKRLATERLEDWGTYAVPSLVALLLETEGADQDAVQYWLRRCAHQRTIPTQDPALMERNRRFASENAELATVAWKDGASPADRAAGVARWQAWFEGRKGRWEWSGLDRFRIGLTDTQFGTYWGNLLRLDLGTSHQYKRPVVDLILERLQVSMVLSILSILIIYVLAIPIGIGAAVGAGSPADRGTSLVLFLLYSLPSFFVGTVLLAAFTRGQHAPFPTSGFSDSESFGWNTWDRLKDILWHITLPLVTMTYSGLAGLSRFARSGMLDVLRADYVRTARAKGLGEGAVIFRHAARNGMMPIVTLLAGFLPALVGGSVVVEYIFNLKGMGLLTIEAINNRDYNIVVGETLIVAALTQLGILLSDVLYAVMDPRISYK
ncbi:MAG: ABC transporter permease [Planctomycetes bacterium]|nr:ABC transporter permease [Planctomycetota bacterium]